MRVDTPIGPLTLVASDAGLRRVLFAGQAPPPGDDGPRPLLDEIPYGTTRSYGAQAQALGAPRAARAVGAANGRNPLPVVLPCHRLVGADGALTGFGGGLDVKRALLAHEAETAVRAAAAGTTRTRTSPAPPP
jgi:O-6-methylguanine DNA methyltransferase